MVGCETDASQNHATYQKFSFGTYVPDHGHSYINDVTHPPQPLWWQHTIIIILVEINIIINMVIFMTTVRAKLFLGPGSALAI